MICDGCGGKVNRPVSHYDRVGRHYNRSESKTEFPRQEINDGD